MTTVFLSAHGRKTGSGKPIDRLIPVENIYERIHYTARVGVRMK